jgi:hypothetical protein
MSLKKRIRGGIPMLLVAALCMAWFWMTSSEYRERVVGPGMVDT